MHACVCIFYACVWNQSNQEMFTTHQQSCEQFKCAAWFYPGPHWHCTLSASVAMRPAWASSLPGTKVRMTHTCVSLATCSPRPLDSKVLNYPTPTYSLSHTHAHTVKHTHACTYTHVHHTHTQTAQASKTHTHILSLPLPVTPTHACKHW